MTTRQAPSHMGATLFHPHHTTAATDPVDAAWTYVTFHGDTPTVELRLTGDLDDLRQLLTNAVAQLDAIEVTS